MPYLVSDLTASARQTCSAFYQDTETDPSTGSLLALDIVNEAHAIITKTCDFYAEQEITINLVAGQRDYAIDPLVHRVNAARLVTSPNYGGIPLMETSIDELDSTSKAWRIVGPGTPFRYFVQATNVGFFQTPNQTTTLGYPYMALDVLKYQPFIALSDALPPQIPNLDAYVFSVLARWAIRNQVDLYQGFAQMAEGALKDLRQSELDRLIRQRPRMRAAIPRVRNP